MCEYCESHAEFNVVPMDVGDAMTPTISINYRSELSIFTDSREFGEPDDYWTVPINYCPMCGRELVGE